METYVLQQLIPKTTNTRTKHLYFGLQSNREPLRETHGYEKQIFGFPCSKILLKISVFQKKIQPTPFRIPTLWERTPLVSKGGHKETTSALGFP